MAEDSLTDDERSSLRWIVLDQRLENIYNYTGLLDKLKKIHPEVYYMFNQLEEKQKEVQYIEKALKTLIDNL